MLEGSQKGLAIVASPLLLYVQAPKHLPVEAQNIAQAVY